MCRRTFCRYLYEEWKQYKFFSLTSPPALAVPDDPTSEDILALQQTLETAYTSEIAKQTGHSTGWVYIEVNASAEPNTIEAMRTNNSATVTLPIPLKNVTDPATNVSRLVSNTLYYQMRLRDVRVYLLDQAGHTLGKGVVQVTLSKAGYSSFFDSNMALHSFTHNPVHYGAAGRFDYDSTTNCPAGGETHGCGSEMCPDFVSYSPFGQWRVKVFDAAQQGVDMSKLVAIRFDFKVAYQSNAGFNPNIFGKDPALYPQNLGKLCPTE